MWTTIFFSYDYRRFLFPSFHFLLLQISPWLKPSTDASRIKAPYTNCSHQMWGAIILILQAQRRVLFPPFFRFYLFIFRQREGGREGNINMREKHQSVVSHAPQPGAGQQPGLCPDRELNPWSLTLWYDAPAQPTELCWPMLREWFFYSLLVFLYRGTCIILHLYTWGQDYITPIHKNHLSCPDRCGSFGWVWKSCWFHSQTGQIPGLQIWSRVRGHTRGNQSMFLSCWYFSPSLSPFSTL